MRMKGQPRLTGKWIVSWNSQKSGQVEEVGVYATSEKHAILFAKATIGELQAFPSRIIAAVPAS